MHTVSDDDEFIAVGKPIPKIAAAEPLQHHAVRIWWRGVDDPVVVDVSPALISHRAFALLRTDDELFRSFRVSEYGDCLEWPGEIELSAVWIERLAEAALGNREFRAAMDELDLSLDAMAAYLGLSRRLIASYRKDKTIPKAVALATRHLLEQRRAYQ
jgi:hypothetical protein